MSEKFLFNDAQIRSYLKRLGMDHAPSLSKTGLDSIVLAHQTHIPFEDLDSYIFKKTPDLDPDALYEKIIERRRGGYCFELNGILEIFLRSLGFDAISVFCRIVGFPGPLHPCSHRGVIVTIDDRRYFCDVGFGGPECPGAVLIEDGAETVCAGEPFQTRIYEPDPNWWVLSRTTSEGERADVMHFNLFPQLPQEFEPANFYCSHEEHQLFVGYLVVNLRTENGSKGIMADTFTRIENGLKTSETITSREQLCRILSDEYGITADLP